MAFTKITNTSDASITLPFPLQGILAPGMSVVVGVSVAVLLATVTPPRELRFSDLPTGTYPGPADSAYQGYLNADGTIAQVPSRYVATAVSYAMQAGDSIVGVTDTSAPRTVTLPASPQEGVVIIVADESNNAAVNPITVQGANGVLINGAVSQQINTNDGTFAAYWNGTGWRMT
jgi:hypothetical protein